MTAGMTSGDFDTVLIAGRGEIACRIVRAVQAEGMTAIAVYSDADAHSPHVRLADRAVPIGPAPAAESYLNIPRIIDAARRTGAGAIHPGYGFLSENAGFAEACAEAGIVFIGPSAGIMRLMGDKSAARQAAIAAGVPCIPGYDGDDQDPAALAARAREIGFPVMIKAAAGGGGRGMRLVGDPARLEEAIASARNEAANAFGDGRLLLERALSDARHVEVQVLADAHGHVLHLGERDCSLQRRHQKIIEESPAPAIPVASRQAMRDAAVALARSVGYVGAGTVEFLLKDNGDFFFLEMNTRLQVEHPVTETITGIDIVSWQLRIAAGEALALRQEDIAFRGHAIEARLCAEDPARDFLPVSGRIEALNWPDGPGLRIDHGIEAGTEISSHYDSLLAKIVAHGRDRHQAIRRLRRALARLRLFPLVTNRHYLLQLLESEAFRHARLDTAFCTAHPPVTAPETPEAADIALHGLLHALPPEAGERIGPALPRPLRLAFGDGLTAAMTVTASEAGHYDIDIDGETFSFRVMPSDPGRLAVIRDDIRDSYSWHGRPGAEILIDHGPYMLHSRNISLDGPGHSGQDTENGQILAPITGRVVEVRARKGEHVRRGTVLAVLEAMKMEHALTAPFAGRIAVCNAIPGQQVAGGTPLFGIEREEDDDG